MILLLFRIMKRIFLNQIEPFLRCRCMQYETQSIQPDKASQSTFLVSKELYLNYIVPCSIRGRKLSQYLHRLLYDPELHTKLKALESRKWKKHYQDPGQELCPLFFYPDESDWASLSIISNATGYSRCYIFVFLMLIDIGVLKIANDRTPVNPATNVIINTFYCSILLRVSEKTLTRKLKKTKKRPKYQRESH